MAVNRQKIWQINFNKYNAVGGGLKCCHPLNYKNTTVNQSLPHVGERGNFLWIAQKHTRNTSCILSTVSTKSQIFEAVWRMGSESCQSSVTNVICNLRKKIEPDSRNPTYIKTILGIGYKFVSGE